MVLDGLYADLALDQNDFNIGIRCGGGGMVASDQGGKINSSKITIQKDYSGVEDNLSILQKHVSNSYNSLSNVREAFSRLGGKISSVAKIDIKEKRLPSNSNEKQ